MAFTTQLQVILLCALLLVVGCRTSDEPMVLAAAEGMKQPAPTTIVLHRTDLKPNIPGDSSKGLWGNPARVWHRFGDETIAGLRFGRNVQMHLLTADEDHDPLIVYDLRWRRNDLDDSMIDIYLASVIPLAFDLEADQTALVRSLGTGQVHKLPGTLPPGVYEPAALGAAQAGGGELKTADEGT